MVYHTLLSKETTDLPRYRTQDLRLAGAVSCVHVNLIIRNITNLIHTQIRALYSVALKKLHYAALNVGTRYGLCVTQQHNFISDLSPTHYTTIWIHFCSSFSNWEGVVKGRMERRKYAGWPAARTCQSGRQNRLLPWLLFHMYIVEAIRGIPNGVINFG